MSGATDEELIEKTHNLARYFVETRHVGWILLFATLLWGYYGYYHAMDKICL